jgi:hypothetical protein
MHTREEMIIRIDEVADVQRKAIAGDPVRMFEYTFARDEAAAYKNGGCVGEPPMTVKSWADAKGWTYQEACDDILRAAAQFTIAMQYIRKFRLTGKCAVQDATTDAEAEIAFNTAIAQLKAIGPVP